jgi:exosortase/archaeosortase family protein
LGINLQETKQSLFVTSALTGDYIIHNKLMSLRYAFYLITGGILLSSSLSRKIKLIAISLVLLQVYNIARIVVLAIFLSSYKTSELIIIREIFELILHLGILAFVIYWFKNNLFLKRLLIGRHGIKKKTIRTFVFNLIIATFVFSFILFFIKTNTLGVANILSTGILKGAREILSLLGYPSNVNTTSCILQGSKCRLHLSYLCLGINLMFVFSAFIVFTKGTFVRKLIFISVGIAAIYFFNILRFVFLFIFVTNNSGNDAAIIDTHDLYSYVIYVLTFFAWAIWLKYFSKTNTTPIS